MAIVGRPELVFVDEPTAGMDPQARRTTWELLEELRADGVTVVLTTHYMDEAERLADQIHIIDRGRLVASGTPLRAHPRRHRRRSGWSSPSRSRDGAPESLQAGARPPARGDHDQRRQPAGHRARRRTTLATVSALVRASTACCRSR